MLTKVSTDKAPAAIGPYSQGIIAGDFLYASGQIAINPATPFEWIKEVLCDVDMILVMTVNPGFAGQKLVPQTLEKTMRLRNYLDENGYKNIEIEVDGNCSFENIPIMKKSGANIFVLGTSSLFRDDISKKDAVSKIHKSMEKIL